MLTVYIKIVHRAVFLSSKSHKWQGVKSYDYIADRRMVLQLFQYCFLQTNYSTLFIIQTFCMVFAKDLRSFCIYSTVPVIIVFSLEDDCLPRVFITFISRIQQSWEEFNTTHFYFKRVCDQILLILFVLLGLHLKVYIK